MRTAGLEREHAVAHAERAPAGGDAPALLVEALAGERAPARVGDRQLVHVARRSRAPGSCPAPRRGTRCRRSRARAAPGTSISTSNSCDARLGHRDPVGDRRGGGGRGNTLGMAGQDSSVPARVVTVSVDLDPVECYWRIHALPARRPSARAPRSCAAACRASPSCSRATACARRSSSSARDLDEDAEGRRAARRAGARRPRAGQPHATRTRTTSCAWAAARIADEIDRAHGAIGACAGTPPVGFRAPGYEISADVIDRAARARLPLRLVGVPVGAVLRRQGAGHGRRCALVGRQSGSVLGSPRVLLAPRAPVSARRRARRTGRGGADIVELPMAVTPVARLPVIGTSLVTAPALAAPPPRRGGAARAVLQPRAARHRPAPTPTPTRSRPRSSPASPTCAARWRTSWPRSTIRWPPPAPPAPVS